jgi:predicted ArsR family transcriptional regulator
LDRGKKHFIMKRTTRYRLIEYIRVKKVVSAAELARVLKITAADARHHLASLEDEGVVVVVDTRVQGRGRPTQLYRLTRDINRHYLDALTSAVLKVWLGGVTEVEREGALRKIAASLTAGWNQPGGNLTQRLTYTVRHLNEMNYLARWEAHIESPRILIMHCPYALMVKDHPETCRMDVFVINNLLGQPVTQISTMGRCTTGELQCIFRLDPVALAIDTQAIAK